MNNNYLDRLFSAKRFTDIHQAVSFISRFNSPAIFAEFNKILYDISPDDETFLNNLLHILDEYPHKIDMLISSLAMYSYSTEISDFQNTLNILRRYITHIPKNHDDYSGFLNDISQVDFSDEDEIQKFIITNKVKNEEPEITPDKKKNHLDFLKKFPIVNFFNKIIAKNKSSEDDTDGKYVPIKSDAAESTETDSAETNEQPSEHDGYSAYKSMIERIGYEDSVVADNIISQSYSSSPSTDSLLQEDTEDDDDTFVSLKSDGEEDAHYSPISFREDDNESLIVSNDVVIDTGVDTEDNSELFSDMSAEFDETEKSSGDEIEKSSGDENADTTENIVSDPTDQIESESTDLIEQPELPEQSDTVEIEESSEVLETSPAEFDETEKSSGDETEKSSDDETEKLSGDEIEKSSPDEIEKSSADDFLSSSRLSVRAGGIESDISKQRIEYRNRIIQALLDVYHDKKTGYKLMLGLFRGLDVFRRMCLTGEEFNKDLFMRNFRKYLTHFPDANLITLCHEKVPDIDESIISQHIIGCMKVLNHHVDKTRFKLLFDDKLNLRSGFNWEYQQRITWLYFPEKRKPKRDIDEIYAVKSVTDSTASKTENTKVKKYRSYISMLSNRDITLANQILGVLHTIYYKRRDCKRFLFHIFKSLDEYDLSAFELTPKQKAIFEANFNKTVLNTNKNPDYPNIFKMIVQNIPKIKPREIESLLPVCIRIMKEKIDIGFERKKRKQPDLANSFNPLEKYSQIYEKKLFIIYKTV
ncbi:MAG: hypothetical protein IKQ61_09170 [Spirochaetales bacterium]|nr:hypothetical protein [Spirochaetales bacterium]